MYKINIKNLLKSGPVHFSEKEFGQSVGDLYLKHHRYYLKKLPYQHNIPYIGYSLSTLFSYLFISNNRYKLVTNYYYFESIHNQESKLLAHAKQNGYSSINLFDNFNALFESPMPVSLPKRYPNILIRYYLTRSRGLVLDDLLWLFPKVEKFLFGPRLYELKICLQNKSWSLFKLWLKIPFSYLILNLPNPYFCKPEEYHDVLEPFQDSKIYNYLQSEVNTYARRYYAIRSSKYLLMSSLSRELEEINYLSKKKKNPVTLTEKDQIQKAIDLELHPIYKYDTWDLLCYYSKDYPTFLKNVNSLLLFIIKLHIKKHIFNIYIPILGYRMSDTSLFGPTYLEILTYFEEGFGHNNLVKIGLALENKESKLNVYKKDNPSIEKTIRSISPHIQIWKPTLNMLHSISHRILGSIIVVISIFTIFYIDFAFFSRIYNLDVMASFLDICKFITPFIKNIVFWLSYPLFFIAEIIYSVMNCFIYICKLITHNFLHWFYAEGNTYPIHTSDPLYKEKVEDSPDGGVIKNMRLEYRIHPYINNTDWCRELIGSDTYYFFKQYSDKVFDAVHGHPLVGKHSSEILGGQYFSNTLLIITRSNFSGFLYYSIFPGLLCLLCCIYYFLSYPSYNSNIRPEDEDYIFNPPYEHSRLWKYFEVPSRFSYTRDFFTLFFYEVIGLAHFGLFPIGIRDALDQIYEDIALPTNENLTKWWILEDFAYKEWLEYKYTRYQQSKKTYKPYDMEFAKQVIYHGKEDGYVYNKSLFRYGNREGYYRKPRITHDAVDKLKRTKFSLPGRMSLYLLMTLYGHGTLFVYKLISIISVLPGILYIICFFIPSTSPVIEIVGNNKIITQEIIPIVSAIMDLIFCQLFSKWYTLVNLSLWDELRASIQGIVIEFLQYSIYYYIVDNARGVGIHKHNVYAFMALYAEYMRNQYLFEQPTVSRIELPYE